VLSPSSLVESRSGVTSIKSGIAPKRTAAFTTKASPSCPEYQHADLNVIKSRQNSLITQFQLPEARPTSSASVDTEDCTRDRLNFWKAGSSEWLNVPTE
jgi:hypothetical protein